MDSPLHKRPWQQLACTWVEPNGQAAVDFRHLGIEVQCWLEHQARHYPDRALIVEDEVKSLGKFDDVEHVSRVLKGRHLARRQR